MWSWLSVVGGFDLAALSVCGPACVGRASQG